MSAFTNLPIEFRLKILTYLTKSDVLACRAVDRTFLPIPLVLGLSISSHRPPPDEMDPTWNPGLYEIRATIALDLVTSTSILPHFRGGYCPRKEGSLDLRLDLDLGRIHPNLILSDRIFQNLNQLPVSLLSKAKTILLFGPAVPLPDLELLVQNCASLRKLCMMEMDTNPEVVEKVTEILTRNMATLTQIGYSDSYNNGNICGILHTSSPALVWLGCGRGGGRDVNLLPTCLTSLILQTAVGILELEAVTRRCVHLRTLSLTIDEHKKPEPGQFTDRHLADLLTLPGRGMTEMTFRFLTRRGSSYDTSLTERLRPLASRCREGDGIFGEIGVENATRTLGGGGGGGLLNWVKIRVIRVQVEVEKSGVLP